MKEYILKISLRDYPRFCFQLLISIIFTGALYIDEKYIHE